MISPELLRRYSFFSGFSSQELKDLAMAAKEQTLPAGQVLFEEGDSADNFYFLADGEMETLVSADGEPIPTSTLPAGEPVGWSALIEPRLYTASAKAARPCRIIAFPRQELGRLLESPHFAALFMRKLAEVVSRRLRDTQIQLVSLTVQQKV